MDRLQSLAQEVKNEIYNAGIELPENIRSEIKINTRAKKRLGCCVFNRKEYTIEISSFVLEEDDRSVKEVLAHEFLHACKGCFKHTGLWKKHAGMLNGMYGYNIVRAKTVETEETKDPKYILKCERCALEYKRYRECSLTKYPWRYRCKCGGKLKRIK